MRRRAVLAATGAAVGSLAGCTAVTGERRLSGDDEVDDRTAVIHFSEDGETLFRLQIVKQFPGEEARTYYPFSVTTWQEDGLRLDSLTLEFRPAPNSGSTAPGIHLREDAHADRVSMSQTDAVPPSTVLELADTSEIGDGSVRVNLLAAADERDGSHGVSVRTAAELSSTGLLGPDYTADDQLWLRFP